MKRHFLFAMCALSTSSLFAAGPISQTGTIKLNGYIYSATCDIDINGQGPDTANINLGRHSTSVFGEKGDETAMTGEQGLIKISLENCPDTGKLEVSFNGTSVSGDSKVLQLDDANNSATAQNIGIHLYDQDDLNTPLSFDGSVAFSANIEGSKNYHKDFLATYVSTADEVSAGKANATLGFKIVYK